MAVDTSAPPFGTLDPGEIRKTACCEASIAVIDLGNRLGTRCTECKQVDPRQTVVTIDDLTA